MQFWLAVFFYFFFFTVLLLILLKYTTLKLIWIDKNETSTTETFPLEYVFVCVRIAATVVIRWDLMVHKHERNIIFQ